MIWTRLPNLIGLFGFKPRLFLAGHESSNHLGLLVVGAAA